MAKKRLTDVPSAKAVRQFLAKREYGKAAEEARKLAGFTPGPEVAALLRECLIALAEVCLDRKQFADFNRLALELEPICLAAGSEAILALGRLYLRGARPRELPRLLPLLTNPSDVAVLQGDWVDHAVRERDPKSLPEEWHPAYTAFRMALGQYEAKADDKAREALNGIGLGSPLLEWKLWLRGLLAWVAGDDGRALENWGRLNPNRLPHRLAAPLRAKADPTWPAEPALKEQLAKRYQRFGRKDLAGQLRTLLPEMGGKKGLGAAFKIAEALLPNLRANHPKLVPQLMHVFYHAMLKRGEPGDLDRFTKAFGRLPDDPAFNRLSAQIFEGIGEPEKSATQWWGYCNWIENQSQWPPLLRRRAIAIVTRKIADQVGGFDSGRLVIARHKLEDPKTKLPDLILEENALLLKAIEYAPDWEEPAAALMDGYLDDGRAAEAIAFAEKYLASNPDAAEVMQGYVEALRRQRRFADALQHFEKLQKAKPFDKDLRLHTAECVLFFAYQLIQNQKLVAAQTMLDGYRDILSDELPMVSAHLRHALAKKAKRTDDAEAILPQLGLPGVVAAFLMHANAVLLKAKPAEKTAASKAYKAALAEGPSALAALTLHARYRFFDVGGIDFTGRKALLKGILDALVNSATDLALTEAQATELIAHAGPTLPMAKFEKLAITLGKRFPKHPLFSLCVAELWYAKNPTKRAPYKILNALRRAKDLVRNSTDPAYKLLEDRIDDLLEELDPYVNLRNMFDSFF